MTNIYCADAKEMVEITNAITFCTSCKFCCQWNETEEEKQR
jgi:hypothetical protein